MVWERDDEPLIQEATDTEHNVQCLDSIDINNSEHLSEAGGQEEDGKEHGRCSKLLQVLGQVTIEPILLLHTIGWVVQSSVSTNLLIAKVIMKLKIMCCIYSGLYIWTYC